MLRAKTWRQDHYFQMAARSNGLPIKKGTRGGSYPRETITDFQWVLLNLGAFAGQCGLPPYQFGLLSPTGVFDAPTEAAVEDFQAKEGLRIDGQAQAETLHRMDERLCALESTTPEAIKEITDAVKNAFSGLKPGGTPSWGKDGPTGFIPGGIDDLMGGLLGKYRGK